jgi:hypothetical protein
MLKNKNYGAVTVPLSQQGYSTLLALLMVVIIGVVGTYVWQRGHAAPPLSSEQVAAAGQERAEEQFMTSKGYQKAKSGPCAGSYKDTSSPEASAPACTHADPGPQNVNLSQRAKQIDQMLAGEAAQDAQNPPKDPGAAPASDEAANIGSGGDLGVVTPLNYPCVGTGTDGYRTKVIYVYPAGNASRLSTYQSSLQSIAKRMNAVVYNSAAATGGNRQIRFATNPDCSLAVSSKAISGDIYNFGNIKNQLRAAGYNSAYRKYLVMVDAYSYQYNICGQGDVYGDDRPTQDNWNNTGNEFAVVWHDCWNYAEPHEFMHMLGGVQPGAPYATPGYHCYDQNDVMCYDDDGAGPVTVQARCTNTVSIWRYDCFKDTYFHAGTASGWLATHWNAANNRFLTH